ncbi:MAG: gamma-glutamyl-gamma-aminobutyrate hydrolase family protein [Candidatus Symbiobacter sp.]|nr:gamma-glutamyl-gamma-aminobutyrate hydrolase family protein [Candidatus Symbiobacter sp.]
MLDQPRGNEKPRQIKPLIGITTYPISPQKTSIGLAEYGFHTPPEYVDAVIRAGGVPVLLPPMGKNLVEDWLDRMDGIIMIGGGDVDPKHYHEKPHETLYSIDSGRDDTELALADAVIRRKMPGLAICRGLQIVNVALGGSLHQHLPDCGMAVIDHRNPPSLPIDHPINIAPHSRLAAIMGVTMLPHPPAIKSWHHQAVKKLGHRVKAVATASDGIIEAIELDDHPDLIAVQWHPELTAAKDASQQKLFDYMVRAAASYRHHAEAARKI